MISVVERVRGLVSIVVLHTFMVEGSAIVEMKVRKRSGVFPQPQSWYL